MGSCGSKQNSIEFQPFEKESLLTCEMVFMDDVIAPDFMQINNHSLFIVSSRSDSMLYQYSLPDMKPLYRGGTQGQGEPEFSLFPMLCKSFSNLLYVWGYTPFTIKSFEVKEDTAISFRRSYRLPLYGSFNQMHVIHDSILVYNAMPDKLAIKKVNLNQGKEMGEITFETEDHMESFFYKNRGLVAANDRYIVYAYYYKKQIDIYDAETMQLHKRLTNGDKEPHIQVGDFEGNKTYYVNIVSGTDCFYALCKDGDKDYALEVFDYEGRSKAKYKFDIIPFLFAVDEEDGVLYGYNSNYEDYLLKYALPAIE